MEEAADDEEPLPKHPKTQDKTAVAKFSDNKRVRLLNAMLQEQQEQNQALKQQHMDKHAEILSAEQKEHAKAMKAVVMFQRRGWIDMLEQTHVVHKSNNTGSLSYMRISYRLLNTHTILDHHRVLHHVVHRFP
jgi:hypothetical protein